MKPAEVTAADIDAFYEQNKAQIQPRTKEQVEPMIKQYLEQQRQAEMQQKFYEGLRAKHKIKYLIEPPGEVAPTARTRSRGTLRSERRILRLPVTLLRAPSHPGAVQGEYGARCDVSEVTLDFHKSQKRPGTPSATTSRASSGSSTTPVENQQALSVEKLKPSGRDGMNADRSTPARQRQVAPGQAAPPMAPGGCQRHPGHVINGRFLSAPSPQRITR